LLSILGACQGRPTDEGGLSATAADGVPIAYTDQGEGDVAVLLIHGWSGSKNIWSAITDEIAAEYRVVAMDLAGHGESGSGRAGWPLADFAKDVQAVVDDLGLERVILVGHSMGGPIALDAAQLMPRRVIGVIGVDTLNNVDTPLSPGQVAMFTSALERDFEQTCHGFVRSNFPRGADPAQIDEVIADVCATSPEVAVTVMKQLPDWDMKAAMSAVTAPIHCINSDGMPTDAEANRRYDPDFQITIIPGVGHFMMVSQPTVFNQVLLSEIDRILAG